MKSRMIWNDIARNKAVALMLLLFVSAASMLLSSAAVLGANLSGSIDRLMQDARTPHFMQMHTGELELDRLEAFAAEQAQVSQFQVVRFLNMDNDSIEINGGTLSGSLQDNGFCTQSGQFDFLLDADGVPVRPADGEVYAPVFYRKDGVMKLGDTISIHGLRFTIAGFVRDSQMNSALASSKRFVVSEADYARLEPFGAVEYLIEFCLDDRSHLGAFTAAYSAAGLPANGPALTWPLFRMMSAISDGIMIAVVLLVGILVILIALLCIRFTLLAKIEDDYREIGTMKAIGMRVSDIRSLYLSTYGAILAAGCVLGFGLSLLFVRLMTGGIRQNLGSSGNDTAAFLLGLAGVLLLFLFVLLYVSANLRRFGRISAAEAIRFGMAGQNQAGAKTVRLGGGIPLNLSLGMQDVWIRKRLYGTMFIVVILAVFIMIVPQNLYHTISAKDFITYMGVGRCDLRMDLQQIDRMGEKVADIAACLEADSAVSEFAVLTTKTFGVRLEDGTTENSKVELGDHAVFPVACVSGRMPLSEQEISLSVLCAEEWEKEAGDSLTLLTADGEKTLTVCGIYSDITNGGKTAKAVFSDDSTKAVWSTVCISLKDPNQLDSKKAEYGSRFPFAKISGIEDYIAQTFGQTLRSVRTASLVSVLVAAAITLLVTLLFLKLLVAKDRYSIAVMKAMGFTDTDVKKQYLWRAVTVLAVGIVCGTVLAGTLGEKLAAAAISMIGAAAFRFVVNLPATYLFCPLIMLFTALIAIAVGTAAIHDIRISQAIKE